MAGDRWMIRGPTRYTIPVEVEVIERRKAVALDSNEGIYVRDTKEGTVRAVYGGHQAYMLKVHEELAEIPL